MGAAQLVNGVHSDSGQQPQEVHDGPTTSSAPEPAARTLGSGDPAGEASLPAPSGRPSAGVVQDVPAESHAVAPASSLDGYPYGTISAERVVRCGKSL